MALVYLSLGSNVGDRIGHLRKTVGCLKEGEDIRLIAVSCVYTSEPLGVIEQPSFLNAVVCIETSLPPEDLLLLTQAIERSFGRNGKGTGGPRTIDIDLLFYDNLVMNTPELTIPHPRIPDRAFVLLPLTDIDASFRHPVSGETVTSLLQDRCHGQRVVLYRETLDSGVSSRKPETKELYGTKDV